MKAEIIYDGNVAEKRVRILKNLSQLTTDNALYTKIRDAEARVLERDRYIEYVEENNMKCHLMFDAVLGESLYDVVVIGNFGLAFKGPETNPIFNGYDKVYAIQEPDDLQYLKPPLFGALMSKYESMALQAVQPCKTTKLVNVNITIDEDMFLASSLWKELELRRRMLAENFNCELFVIYRVRDVLELLNLMPSEPITSSPISVEFQEVILKAWNNFIDVE